METREIRNYKLDNTEIRAYESEDKKIIEGYASRYNQRSKLISEKGKVFYEIIERGAFKNVLTKNPDVVAIRNHNRDQVMARTTSGTLTLSEDEKGLRYSFEVPNISYAQDLYESIKRGDIYESSFAFSITNDDLTVSKDERGNTVRTIKNITNLFDVSPVTDGAYSNTYVSARGLEEFENSEHQSEVDKSAQRQRFLEIRKDIYKE